MPEQKKPNFLKGTAILAATVVIVKVIGAVYQIPLLRVLGDEGAGYFHVTYMIYGLLLAISTAGVPVALSRLVSSALARDNMPLVKRYYSVAMPAIIIIGIIFMSVMYFYAGSLARMMHSSMAVTGIRVLAPAVFFGCVVAVYRGYAQGFQNMVPTAASQLVEVISKAVIGLAVAFYLARLGYQSHFVSAGAIVGVTVGMGLCIPVMIWYKRKIDRKQITEEQLKNEESTELHKPGKASSELMSRSSALFKFLKVSFTISLSASFMSIMGVIDTSVVSNRLQSALMLTESEAAAQLGIFRRGISIFNLPPSLVVPLVMSIIPAIAAAIAQKNRKEANEIMQSSMKLTNLFAMPACAGIMVLAGPILSALYHDPSRTPQTVATMTTILFILGAASYFVCLQHVTIATLQANGYERVALMTFPVGAVIRIVLSWILVANPSLGIIGSPIATLVCFMIIVILNTLFIKFKVKAQLKPVSVFIKPLLCALIMAAVAYFTYTGANRLATNIFGSGQRIVILSLAVAISAGILIYVALIIFTKTITKEDLSYVPKGEKIAKLLRVN